MKLKSLLMLGTAALVGAVSFSNVALATSTANATFGAVSFGGSGTFQGSAHLGSAQAFRYSSSNLVNEVPALFNGVPNNFASGSTAVPVGSAIIFPGALFNITGVFPGTNPALPGGPLGTTIPRVITPYLVFGTATDPTRYDFDIATITFSSSGPSNLDYAATGTFVDTLGTFSTNSALLSFAATQVGTGSALNYSVTFDTPAPVPEPESLSLLGIGLLGLSAVGFVRRQSNKSA